MAIAIIMPKLGLTMETGIVGKWLAKEGDEVKKGAALVEITTEKLVNTVEVPQDGILLKIVANEGDELPVGGLIAYIGAAGEAVPWPEHSMAAEIRNETYEMPLPEKIPVSGGGRIRISPAARALAKKLDLDYSDISGTGPGGRIIKNDIQARSEAVTSDAPDAPSVMGGPPATVGVQREIPYSGMRRAIGVNMSSSWTTAPMVTHHVMADVTEMLALRGQINAGVKEGEVKVSVTDMLIKIVAKALKQMPLLNSTLQNNIIKLYDDINMGMAISLKQGLVVAVLPRADQMNLFQISRETKRLSSKAKEGGLSANEMSGGTFTISNVGGFGSVDFFTPIINQPESAILGVGRIQRSPVVTEGDIIQIRSIMGLSLTFDHRVIDGAPAAEFLAVILELLKYPAKAIIE